MRFKIIGILIIIVSATLGGYSWWQHNTQASTLQAPSKDGLVGYWSFDDGSSTKATDFSGMGNTGTLTGSGGANNLPRWIDGKVGKALNFDGTDDYVISASSSGFPVGNAARTMSVWVNSSSISAGFHVATIYGVNAPDSLFAIYRDGADLIGEIGGGSAAQAITMTGYFTSRLNQWHLITLTMDSSQELKLYSDGVLIGGPITATTANTATSNLYIGGGWEGSGYEWGGSLDEVRIYNRALTQTEITNLYQVGAATMKNPTNTDLVGYWSFNDGSSTKATDFSGMGNTGTLNGSGGANNLPQWVDGRLGKALSFDGTDDYISTSANHITAGDFSASVCTWAKLDDTSQGACLVSMGDSYILSGYCLAVGLRGTGKISAEYFGIMPVYTANVVPSNSWNHICITKTPGMINETTKIYLNGTVQNHTTPANGTPNFIQTTPTRIGTDGPDGNTSLTKGSLDEVRIYNRALTQSEITNLYQSGLTIINASQNTALTDGLVGMWSFNGPDVTDKVYDRSGQGNHGYFMGGATSSAKTIGKVGQALSFDGVDDYVYTGSIADNLESGPFSVSAWFKLQNTFSGERIQHIFFLGDLNSINDFRVCLGGGAWPDDNCNSPTGKLCLTVYTSGGNWANACATPTSWPSNEWQHVVATFSTSEGEKLYVNGILDGSNANTDRGTVAAVVATIGTNENDLTSSFGGSIDDVRVYNRALSATEAATLYAMGK